MERLSILSQILTIILLAGYAYILFKSRLNGKILKRSALIILTAGTIEFMIGFAYEDIYQSPVTAFFRAFMDSAKMFLYDCDYVEIVEAQKLPFYTDILILTYYAAMLTSISAIIMLFGKRAMTSFTLSFRKKPFKHIFLGINSRSEIIAKGIKDQDIAFIEFPDDEEKGDISIASVIKNVTHNDKGFSWISSGNITLLRAKRKLLHHDSGNEVFQQIGLDRLYKLISPETAFYILGDDSDVNLQDLLVLVKDPSIRNNTIHTCVKREGLARPYQSVLGKTGAHFIYPSSLAVVELMNSTSCHPSNVMKIDTDNCTSEGQFNALVVGFGETGQAAVKFLYEFSSGITKDGSVLPVKIFINDEHLDGLKGQFMFSCPEMNHNDILVYENYGLDSGDFWDTLLKRLDDLNYIEISMNDDAVNLNLACTIFGYAEKKRKGGFNNFRIIVRKRRTPVYERQLVDRLNEKAGREVITCFGEYEKIFTPEMIVSKNLSGINETATALADKIRTAYDQIAGEQPAATTTPGTYHDKRRIRRETHQYISRANHAQTKLLLSGGKTSFSDNQLENLAKCEHLRFARYLLAHGYTFDIDDDDVLKTNHQLCPWEKLSDQDKQYHRDMVMASLSL